MLHRPLALLACATAAGGLLVTAGWSLFRGAHPNASTVADRATSSTKVDSDDLGGEKQDVGLWSRVGNHSARIEALEREIADLKRAKPAASARHVRLESNGSDPGAGIDPEQEKFEDEQVNKKLQSYFTSQTRDARWAGDYEAQIAEFAKKYSNDAQVTNVECRTSMCRMEVNTADERSRAAFFQNAESSLSDWGALHYEPEATTESGRVATVMEVFRKGYPLPSL